MTVLEKQNGLTLIFSYKNYAKFHAFLYHTYIYNTMQYIKISSIQH